ncbi:MAG TPA: NAD-dependent epimerase/dehydratase family protein [Kofleriaceae bacterium]|nr:NAD-dependent epimerase/dehydratase family protein [Kofleriaceae bacterium]
MREAASGVREAASGEKDSGAGEDASDGGQGASSAQRTFLVTGATGFLGEHVARVAVARGHSVRGLARSPSPVLSELGVEELRGDVTCAEEVAAAAAGCEGVFHLAGLVSRDPDDGQRMMRVHVDGTRTVLRECARAGVRRVVIASSSGTVAVSRLEAVHDEAAGYATEVVAGWPYYCSKIYQEKVAHELGEELGIEVVVVSPSLLLGPGDRRQSSTQDVQRFLRRQIPIVPPGGLNFVDVRDAAEATVAAMEHGRAGERYLLGGPNWTFREFFGRLERVAKQGGPRLRVPGRLARAGASLVERAYRAAGKEPPVDRISVEMSEHFWYVDSSKAERELGFEARDPQLTLADTVKYLRQGVGGDL